MSRTREREGERVRERGRGQEGERNQVPRENKGQRSEGQAETGRQTAGTAMDRRQFENWSTKLINITHTHTKTHAGRQDKNRHRTYRKDCERDCSAMHSR